jgi:phosphopantothenoylcysteine synthetase/decarboxylase
MSKPKKAKNVLLGVCASIAAYKACDIIRRLQEAGCNVKVIMTKEAKEFITPLSLASLSGKPVLCDMFEITDGSWQMPHISLARESDVFLIAPATANMIAKLALGLADDLISCTALSMQGVLLIAPAMNDEMYQSRTVQKNCKELKSMGASFIEPKVGKLACGVTGVGHLADVEDIVKAVLNR